MNWLALLTVMFSWDECEWKIRGHPYVRSVYVWGDNHAEMAPRGTDAVLMVNINPKGSSERADDWASEFEEDFYFKYENAASFKAAQRKVFALATEWAKAFQQQADEWKRKGKKVAAPWR